jgi:thymidylate kinase
VLNDTGVTMGVDTMISSGGVTVLDQDIPRSNMGSRVPVLSLIRKLCTMLEAEEIVYCHWKSNAALERSASGDNDLDLLVDRGSAQRFTEILWRCGFKEARTTSDCQLPGVLDYYGYDVESDRLVHVHAHYQLILGHDATKSFRLPIERAYLASAVQGDLFRVPSPEFELVVFLIRMVLKHSTWDAIIGREGALAPSERRELSYLQSRASWPKTADVLKQHLPYIDAELFDACLQSLQPNCSPRARAGAARRLQGRLSACARRPRLLDLTIKLERRLVEGIQRRLLRHVPAKRVASGGLLVALVGGDGSGKTTAVDGLYAWLAGEFETTKVHLGKPAWSRTTIIVRGILKIGRSLGLYPFMRAPIAYTLDASSVVFPGYPWLLREVCTARDRYLTYANARRLATNGEIVICDRFPLPQVKLMDGPQVERMTASCKSNRLMRSLVALEKSYYRPIAYPDLLVVLKTDPETSVRRKPDEDAASVRSRGAEIWEADWQQTPAYVIDASRPQAEVLCELKELVWSHL